MKKYLNSQNIFIVFCAIGGIVFWTYVGMGVSSLKDEPSSLQECFNAGLEQSATKGDLKSLQVSFKEVSGHEIFFLPTASRLCQPWAGAGKFPDFYAFKVSVDQIDNLTNQIDQIFSDNNNLYYQSCKLVISKDTEGYSLSLPKGARESGCYNSKDGLADFEYLNITIDKNNESVGFEFYYD